MEATRRLRESYPDAPIYVRSRVASDGEELVAAGATEIVVEAVEGAVRFSSLLGVETEATDKKLRTISAAGGGLDFGSYSGSAASRAYTEGELSSLAMTCSLSMGQVVNLYDVYQTLDVDDDGEVELEEIRGFMMRMSNTPVDDDALATWLKEADADGDGTVSFTEFVRVSGKANQLA